MFSLYLNPNFYANPYPNPVMFNCYIQACRISLLAGGCSGISTVRRVRVMVTVKVTIRDRYVKELEGTDVVWM